MKNKVLTLKNDVQIYVVDEVIYKNHRYVYGLQCDNKLGELSNNHLVLEAKINAGKLVLDNINDFGTASIINNIFLSRFRENKVFA